MARRLLYAALVPLLTSACGWGLTSPDGESEQGVLFAVREVEGYRVEFRTNAGQQQEGVTATVQFRVMVAELVDDYEGGEPTISWRMVENLPGEILCREAGGFEETHFDVNAGGGLYETVHLFNPGGTYAALRFPGGDGTVEAGFWVDAPTGQ
ncbi:MAG: hypothetical protein HY700_17795 [Gemmatimonadetes bacterium]|nr:hypothetical protein [Gemmatimonadota bacterium]